MTDPQSPSTSYKSSLDGHPRNNDIDQALVLVNPCYAAPTPFTELQPFSSRQSQSKTEHDLSNPVAGEHTWPTILEEGEKGVYQDRELQDGIEHNGGGGRTMSKTKMFLTAAGMCLTYFLGVSSLTPVIDLVFESRIYADCQTASSAAVTLMIPDIARSLEVSELSAQWVVSAYSLAYGW